MPDITIYHLNPRSAFHFGVRGLEQETTGIHFPSDSLFAALLTAWMELGNDPASLAGLFPQETAPDVAPPFLLTSVFPRAGAVRFYPALPLRRMLLQQKLKGLNAKHRLKEVKKIQFISERLFERAVAGSILDEFVPSETATDTDAGWYMQGGALWLTREEAEQLPEVLRKTDRHGSPAAAVRQASVWKQSKVPRVTVDRISNASQIFHTGRVRFQKDCGLWFGIRWLNPGVDLANGTAIRTAVETALDVLGDSGIGAERSAGYGQFSVVKPVPAPQCLSAQSGNQFVTLSRFHPGGADDVFGSETTYGLEAVSGWVRSPVEAAQRRRRVWFVKEGSILQASSTPNPGRIVDVRPRYDSAEFSHPVWRYGLAFPVGLTDRREK